MLIEPKDQDQSSGSGSEDVKSDDSKETENEDQSEDGKKGEKETEDAQKLMELPDGRKVDPKTFSKEWKENFYPEFTRRSQRLRDYERAEEAAKSEADKKAREAVADNAALKGVSTEVKEAIIQIVTPKMNSMLEGITEKTAQENKDKAFTAELDSLEGKYPGKDGLPKFDRAKVITKMREPGNRDFDPESVYQKLNSAEIRDHEIKEALRKQKGGARLETTGKDTERKPSGKVPKTFAEAGKAALSRLSS